MKRKAIHMVMAVMAAGAAMLSSCYHGDMGTPTDAVREGYVALRFTTDIPAMEEVVTRSVDPDGIGVQEMTLFCFDTYGLFISTVSATLTAETDTHGTFQAEVPENTRTVHFLGNQNMSEFAEDEFRNKSEAEVMALLEGSSGRMIYWARFACPPDSDLPIDEALTAAGGHIRLIRNHAQVSVANPDNEWLQVTGFVVYNTNAFGTVAPYHPTKGFDFQWPSDDDPFVTLPLNEARMSDIANVTNDMSQYVFECENSASDPVSVILRGHRPGQTEANDLYYRVLLLDDNGEQLLVRRNHNYILNIAGSLSFGQPTFAEAIEAPATNNVWISISDEVNSVQDNDYTLTVEQTAYVLGEELTGGRYSLSYTVSGNNGTPIEASDAAEVTWIDNNVATNSINTSFTVDAGTGYGQIDITLLPMGDNNKREGTLLVKKGRLQRRIKIITISQMQFIPSWVSTQIYGAIENNTHAHVTAMFTIPENCPEELFPLRVFISTDELNIRAESGMTLSVVYEGDEGYYGDHIYGYKYVYVAEQPGVQRIYLENILNHANNDTGNIVFEAEFFDRLDKTYTFSETQESITVDGLNKYQPTSGGDSFAADEVILYSLVPQKLGANVQFDMVMMDLQNNTAINAGEKDEFILYSQYLDSHKDGDEELAGVTEFDCTFYQIDESEFTTGGRMLMFKPRRPTNPTQGTGRYSIYMKTNRASSAEVVRIASNQSGSSAMLPEDGDSAGMYEGKSYRSVTFELANYNPFEFNATVNGIATAASGSATPATLQLSYEPDQPVDMKLDVTSFSGSDGKSVDPFGMEFDIYIDAPMLEIDEGRLAACNLNGDKLKADPSVPGRFIYTVAADRDTERTFGTDPASATDALAATQHGERKTLPFRTVETVSAGTVTISSDKEKVVFVTEEITVANTSITGTISYQEGSGTPQAVPKDEFVSFERVRNNSRIGSVTVTADGHYELRLRKEYEFNWYTDEVKLHLELNGNTYHATCPNLATLFDNPNIVLTLAE